MKITTGHYYLLMRYSLLLNYSLFMQHKLSAIQKTTSIPYSDNPGSIMNGSF